MKSEVIHSSFRIARYLLISAGNSFCNSTNIVFLNLRKVSILPFVSSFLNSAFSMQSFV